MGMPMPVQTSTQLNMQSARPHPVTLVRWVAHFARPDDQSLTIKPVYAFPFLYLPAELRDEIYSLLLCFPPFPRTKWSDSTSAQRRESLVYNHRIRTEIWRTNSQVYSEAYATFLRGNQFVRLTVNKFQLEPIPRLQADPDRAHQRHAHLPRFHHDPRLGRTE